MQLNPYLRKELFNDIIFCADKILQEQDLNKKGYFFGHIHYACGKILEINYDKHLAFIQFVLEISSGSIVDRIESIMNENTTIPFIDGFFERLAENLIELANRIERDEDTYEILQSIVEMTYLTTPSGYHQFLRGMIKF